MVFIGHDFNYVEAPLLPVRSLNPMPKSHGVGGGGGAFKYCAIPLFLGLWVGAARSIQNTHMDSYQSHGPFLGSFLIRVPCYGDLKRNATIENYPI